MMQTLVTILVLAASVAYVVWRIHQLKFKDSDSCHDCDGCTMKKQICDKKRYEKFG